MGQTQNHQMCEATTDFMVKQTRAFMEHQQNKPTRLGCFPWNYLSLAPRSAIGAEVSRHISEQALTDLVLDYGGCFLESVVDTIEAIRGALGEYLPEKALCGLITDYCGNDSEYSCDNKALFVPCTDIMTVWQGPEATLLVPKRDGVGGDRWRIFRDSQVVLFHQRSQTVLTFSCLIQDFSTVRYVHVAIPEHTPEAFDALELRVGFPGSTPYIDCGTYLN